MIAERQQLVARYIARRATGYRVTTPRTGAKNVMVVGADGLIRYEVGKIATRRQVKAEGDAGWVTVQRYRTAVLAEAAASTTAVTA